MSVRKYIFIAFFFLFVGAGIFLHLYKIDSIPNWVHIDEISVAKNAFSIEENGFDEHGVVYPIYFKAFGEYKNPIYIYTVSLSSYFFGHSLFVIRSVSFFYWFLFACCFVYLVHLIFNKKEITMYALFVVIYTPWFFSLSRISFEVISQPLFLVFFLIGLYKTYFYIEEKKYKQFLWALGTGISLCLFLYSYSTGRLLAFLFILIILGVYHKRVFWIKNSLLTISFFLGSLPFLYFLFSCQGALTSRFHSISYWYDPHLNLLNKVLLFIWNIIKYHGLEFLVLNGDPNRVHHTGVGGELLFITFILFIFGMIYLFSKNIFKQDNKFSLLLVCMMYGSLGVASLVYSSTYHSLVSLVFGVFLVLFSCYGLRFLIDHFKPRKIYLIIGVLILFQSSIYIYNYFNNYTLPEECFDVVVPKTEKTYFDS